MICKHFSAKPHLGELVRPVIGLYRAPSTVSQVSEQPGSIKTNGVRIQNSNPTITNGLKNKSGGEVDPDLTCNQTDPETELHGG